MGETDLEFKLLYDIHFAIISRAKRGFQHLRETFRNFATLPCKFCNFTSQLSLLRVKIASQFSTHLASFFPNCEVPTVNSNSADCYGFVRKICN